MQRQDQTLFELEQRVRKLERRNGLLGSTLLVCLCALLLGMKDPDQVSGQKFQLTGAEGQVLAVLESRDGLPGLYLMDEQGRERVALVHETEQSGLFVKDLNGDTRVGLAQFSHGGGGLALHGQGMKGAAVLYHKKAGSMTLYDAEGGITYRIPEGS